VLLQGAARRQGCLLLVLLVLQLLGGCFQDCPTLLLPLAALGSRVP
jgi:hypothetical protein